MPDRRMIPVERAEVNSGKTQGSEPTDFPSPQNKARREVGACLHLSHKGWLICAESHQKYLASDFDRF